MFLGLLKKKQEADLPSRVKNRTTPKYEEERAQLADRMRKLLSPDEKEAERQLQIAEVRRLQQEAADRNTEDSIRAEIESLQPEFEYHLNQYNELRGELLERLRILFEVYLLEAVPSNRAASLLRGRLNVLGCKVPPITYLPKKPVEWINYGWHPGVGDGGEVYRVFREVQQDLAERHPAIEVGQR